MNILSKIQNTLIGERWQLDPSETKFFLLPLHVVKKSLRNFYKQNYVESSELSILEILTKIQKTLIGAKYLTAPNETKCFAS